MKKGQIVKIKKEKLEDFKRVLGEINEMDIFEVVDSYFEYNEKLLTIKDKKHTIIEYVSEDSFMIVSNS